MNPGTESIPLPGHAPEAVAACEDDADLPGENPGLRLLVVMRHAKAAGHHRGGDQQRPLTESGRKAAAQMGRWLVRQGVRPDVVVTSPSVRTLQTWEGLRVGGMRADDVWADAGIYGADTTDLIESVTSVPDDVQTLVLIGHAPGVGDLVALLEDHTGGGEAIRADQRAWPPGSVGVIAHRGPWETFPGEDTALVAFHTPDR
ncbi:SixA phosphatase family protein [Gephyromycinifex aptenodytis]|uniref:SixA phosphatase family protein n=1 Tax=Gephyromycinifex aptenodytis TaxID=2716227 RepID=UPI00144665B8|nr:histidine phosphatase family protein [Gephyromycinifex aptenodytis]